MSFSNFFKQQQKRINFILDDLLSKHNANTLAKAMHYAVLNGGKRFRPILIYATGLGLGAQPEALDIPACAIELLHSFSLVHDDLPAMDNDDFRRGKPACHKAFDEATAILAGDALLALSFEHLAIPTTLLTPAQQIKMIQILANACGKEGMALGQALDMENQQAMTVKQLDNINLAKTGELLKACVLLGAIASDIKDPAILDALTNYAKAMGLAFQIHDDILDIEASTQTLGKPKGSDKKAGKITYPELIGLHEAKKATANLYEEALTYLQKIKLEHSYLKDIAKLIISRKN